ncbi:MAG TPA: hypothetical protein VHL30_01365 [Chlamydiales bacterium]|nr:hypothetical protein [Chlamydiales bacterium]
MRRFVLACFLFFLLCGALCHLQVVGFFLKLAAKSQANSLLAYREIQFEEGRLILKDAVLFDTKGQKSSYFLRSEKISVTPVWNWPLSFFVHVEKPHIIVSAEHFKNSSLSAEKPPFKWEVELEEGVLEWIDNAIPSSRFSLYLTSEESLEMGMSWEPGVLEIEKKGKACRGEWSDLPFDFLRIASEWSRFSLPISHAQGRWNGHAEMDLEEKKISLTASGKNLSFQCKQIHCETSLAFEGIWKENAVEKIRLSVEEGTLQSFPSEIQAIESLLTYQSGLGVKVVGKAVAVKEGLEIPGEWGGKVFFNRDQFEWANGDISFGKANGTLSWSGEKLERAKWTLAWEQFGAEEIAVLQGFAAKFAPMIKDWVWHSGTVQGEISFASGPLQASSPSVLLSEPNLLLIEAKDLTVETPFFVFAAKNGSYKAGNWEIEALRVENQELSFQGNAKWESQFHDNTVVLVGDIAGIHFAGTGDLDGEQLLLSIPRFEGSLPSCLWPNSRGKVQAEGNGFEMRGSWSGIEDWFLACKITEGHASSPSCSLSNFECSLMADPDSIDVLSAQGLLSIPVGERVFSASFFAPRIQWKEDAAHFDLRLHDSATDLLRLKGSKTGEKFQLDSVYSHCFGQRIVLQRGIWQKGSFSALDLEAEIDWPLFESYLRRLGLDLWKDFPKLDKILFSGHLADQEMAFTLAAPPFSQKEEDSSWSLTAEKKGNKWNIEMWVGSTACSCGLDYKEGLFRASDGRVAGPGISFAFEGTMTRTLEGALILKKIWADCKQIPSINLAGSIGGQAQVSFTKAEIQADLDLLIKETVFEGLAFENTGPLHLH